MVSMSGWVFLVSVLMGGFMAWRERYLSARKPPAIPSYLAGALGGLGVVYVGQLLVRNPGGVGGEIALALLFSACGAGLAVALVDLTTQHRNTPPHESAAP
jgi:hypothetical protein